MLCREMTPQAIAAVIHNWSPRLAWACEDAAVCTKVDREGGGVIQQIDVAS